MRHGAGVRTIWVPVRLLAVLLASALLGLAPAAASAAVRCIGTTGQGCDTTHATISSALVQAANDDTLRFGPGLYVSPQDPIELRLHFVGAGQGTLDQFDAAVHTRIRGTAGSPGLILTAGGSLRSLQVQGGAHGGSLGRDAIHLYNDGGNVSYSLADVVLLGTEGADENQSDGRGMRVPDDDGTTDVSVTDSAFRAGGSSQFTSTILIIEDSGSVAIRRSMVDARDGQEGLRTDAGAFVLLEDSSVGPDGGIAHWGTGPMRIIRSRVSTNGSRAIDFFPLGPGESVMHVIDSLIEVNGTESFPSSAAVVEPNGGVASLVLRGSTVIARGNAQAAVRVVEDANSRAELRNTIARVEGSSAPGAADLIADQGKISADFSAFATSSALNGGSTPAPGSGSNFSGHPPLNPDLSLPAGSPLADRGDPGAVEPGELDLAGNPRSLDGNGDCVAAPDIGAFELPALACPSNAAPSITGFGITNRVFAPLRLGRRAQVKRGTRFRYTLSEPASVAITIERRLPGRRVGRRCRKATRRNRARRRCARFVRAGVLRAQKQAGRQTTPFSGRFRRRALRRGRYRARIRATDAHGARSAERRLVFRVVKAPRRRR
ncbi:MAG TPA: hypothetical protein VHG69_13570 [Thermoleophilaceae bacterium]|nr:hypothetical protein [Thermoleophilaceae bacterium]